MKSLLYWSSRFWYVVLDEDEHKFRRRFLFGRKLLNESGWACRSSGEWFAVYKRDGELIFRCNDWSCPTQGAHECILERGKNGVNVFSVNLRGDPVFRHEYKVGAMGELLDVTYDDLDAEQDDFFLWLSRKWGREEQIRPLVNALSE